MTAEVVGVVGAGTMGSGIAQVLAESGRQVLLVDRERSFTERGVAGIRARLGRRVEQGRMKKEDAEAVAGRVTACGGIDELKPATFLIEAVFESVEAKAAVYRQLNAVCGEGIVLASNTSGLSITRLGASVKCPERFVGMHFFNPVPTMKLVEVVRGQLTGEETVAKAVTLTQGIGKTAVVVNDAPGFAVTRILSPLMNEGILMLSEGLATREDIDLALKLGANHPMGPLELADLVGLDVLLDTLESLQRDFGDSKYRPAPLLKKMVAAGQLGRKAGRGFYEYGERR